MIRRAEYGDIEDIMDFIKEYWKKDHILATNREFFEYEHCAADGKINFVISLDADNKINGILGYIPHGEVNKDIMTVMWKVKPGTNDRTLGLKLLSHITKDKNTNIVASPGSNKKVLPIYDFLKYKTGLMEHFYRLNPVLKPEEFKIAKIEELIINKSNIKTQYELMKADTFGELCSKFSFEDYYMKNTKPKKEKWYIEKRYFEHPIYKYQVYTINDFNNNKKSDTFLVFRIVRANGSCCLRLIDVLGDYEKIKYITNSIDLLMNENKCEYTDIYFTGLDKSIFLDSGWVDRYQSKENILPNHFEPYEQKNIDVYYFSTDKDIVLFKGDGDQDRPS